VRRLGGGLTTLLGIAALVVLFFTSIVIFTPAFQEQPLEQEIVGFAALFFNTYFYVAAAVVLGWFVYRQWIGPQLRYNKLRRMRAAQGRSRTSADEPHTRA
jgi:hypothetical protein